MKKTAVLIVAAGQGRRAPGDIPKQYRNIGGMPVLEKTLKCFTDYGGLAPTLVAIHPDHTNYFRKVRGTENVLHIKGGSNRTESVKNGLQAVSKYRPDFVLIHDAARPFLSGSVISNVLNGLKTHNACVPTLPIIDALKSRDGSSFDRNRMMRAQTPQGFHFKKILSAYTNLPPDTDLVDDIEVAKTAGLSIRMCPGDERNTKLTTNDDFARIVMVTRTGSGIDVHRICEGQSLHLCGVKINTGFSLAGHSDADVGLHALTDALLGAIADGDIGAHFPSGDPKWKNADSVRFLEFARDRVEAKGGQIDHVDVTLICEKPKIAPYREKMRARLSEMLQIPIGRISVKATTTEGLGFTGRGEGIAAQAMASIRMMDV